MNIKLIHTHIKTKIILQKIKVAVIYLFLVEIITVNDAIIYSSKFFLMLQGLQTTNPKNICCFKPLVLIQCY